MTEILQTQNKNWGCWGVASSYTDKEQMPKIWAAAFKIIQNSLKTLRLPWKQARGYYIQ